MKIPFTTLTIRTPFTTLKRSTTFAAIGLAFIGLAGCSKDDDGNGGGGGINLYSIEDDKQLGAQVAAEIASDPAQFPVLQPEAYPVAYSNLNRIVNVILNSGQVPNRDAFDWQVRIIRNDSTLNAFAAPGGYIYVYTGIIKYLDKEDDFAGVMAHEIAHAARRHVTQQMTKNYGLQVLIDVALGNNQNVLTQIAGQLVSLGFSRSAESDADDQSVDYLCGSEFAANGAAGFFEKLIRAGQTGGTPQFLSTHPNPDNRVEAITMAAVAQGCDTTSNIPASRWAAFQASLP